MDIYETTYLNNITSRGIMTDRAAGDDLKLPYNFDDIKITPNAIATANTINYSLELLDYNFLYLISTSKVPSNFIPFNNTTKLTLSEGTFKYSSPGSVPTDGGVTDMFLTSAVDGVFTTRQDRDGTAGVIVSKDTVALMTGESDEVLTTTTMSLLSSKLVSKNSSIGGTRGDFTNIKRIGLDNNKRLFVLDNSTIYKYNIDGITTTDLSILGNTLSGRSLVTYMGGLGDITDNTKFENPITFSIYDNKIYVLDQKTTYSSAYVKVFDTNFNFIETYNVTSQLSKYPGVDILASKDQVLILSLSGNIIEYTDKLQYKANHKLAERVDTDEEYKRIETSVENRNIFYLLTNKNVFKKFKSKPASLIGNYRIDGKSIGPGSNLVNFKFLSVNSTVNNTYDEVFLGDGYDYGSSSTHGGIYRFLDFSNYVDCVYPTMQTQIFELSGLKIQDNEYINNFVYNKNISKILFNHNILKDNLRGKLTSIYNDNYALEFDGITYPTDQEFESIQKFSSNKNNFIGINEVVLSETVNRPLEQIYNLQLEIVDFLTERITNTVPPSTIVIGI